MTYSQAGGRAQALLEVGRPEEALALVAPLLAASDDPGPHVVAVIALLTLDRPDDASATAAAALGMFGPVCQLARVASYAFRAAGDPQRALEVARAGAQAAPEWVPGLLALIDAELAVGHRVDGIVEVALSLAPHSPQVRLVAARAAMVDRRDQLAREHCLAALALDPADVAAMRALGVLEERRNRPGRAAACYARALRLRPGDAELAERVRALFGRLLGAVAVALMLASLLVFMIFIGWADPRPRPGDLDGPPDPVAWTLWGVLLGVGFGLLTWSSLRGVPRAVLSALVAETRVYRRVRRCARLTLASTVALAGTVLAAVAPVGSPRDRIPVVVPLWLVTMVLVIVLCIALRVAFGYGGTRAARAGRRERSAGD